MIATLLAVLILKFTLAMAPAPYTHRCPKGIEPMQDFDINRYLGRWYEYARYSDEFDVRVRCVYDDFTMKSDGVIVMNYSKVVVPNIQIIEVDEAQVAGPGKLSVCHRRFANLYGHMDYLILGTDYKNYAVAYTCLTLLPMHIRFVWIFMRHRTLTAEQIEETHQILTNHSLELVPLFKTDQTNCDEYY